MWQKFVQQSPLSPPEDKMKTNTLWAKYNNKTGQTIKHLCTWTHTPIKGMNFWLESSSGLWEEKRTHGLLTGKVNPLNWTLYLQNPHPTPLRLENILISRRKGFYDWFSQAHCLVHSLVASPTERPLTSNPSQLSEIVCHPIKRVWDMLQRKGWTWVMPA